ncbi:hypothetical protein GCK72_006672 [Caenorhabditis remanei]|uniref:Uncharacterized protein n=1 Tax=Caenorhabditis remanei TaxID=31234 RepID=A0A6A5HJE9_CAERE|nr:hypothetical protein GCK72_006672 [Caenorhabditis remanei]KAF1766714.1 hypothetical protein GCK72_006672 [Caenorhabditis remanei]
MVVPESFQLDQEILLDAGAQLHRLKMYPYFDVAHYLLNTQVYTILDSVFLPLRVHVHRLGGLLPIWPVVVSDVLHVDEKIWCLLLQMSLDFWTELWCVDELGKMSEGSGINLKSERIRFKVSQLQLTSKSCWGGEPVEILSTRIDRNPAEMMLNKSIESSGDSLISSREALQLSLVEVLYKIIDDDRTVGMLTSIQLDEGDLLTSGRLAELIVDILKTHFFNLVVQD